MSRLVALVGYGYWGKNLARCFHQLGALEGVFDELPERRELAHENYPDTRTWSSYDELLMDERVDAVAIAAPPVCHAQLALAAIKAGKHVFVEKPLGITSKEAQDVEAAAHRAKCALSVGHIYLHNPGIKRIPVPVGKAELYIQLLNEGGAPSDSTRDLKWAGLPHAASLACRFFPDEPQFIHTVIRVSRIQANLRYFNGSECFIDVADYAGYKTRQVELRIGEMRWLFDTATPDATYLRSGLASETLGTSAPPLEEEAAKRKEPLKLECQAFLESEKVEAMGSKVLRLIERIMERK